MYYNFTEMYKNNQVIKEAMLNIKLLNLETFLAPSATGKHTLFFQFPEPCGSSSKFIFSKNIYGQYLNFFEILDNVRKGGRGFTMYKVFSKKTDYLKIHNFSSSKHKISFFWSQKVRQKYLPLKFIIMF